ncbi:uncharacterized protein LOC141595097 [Silene latifolia]|uniref:uncharacterized protein LOC141595097 n=1 Tax=Silene latifolia TaxID=37657 RepID=UPI003D774C30
MKGVPKNIYTPKADTSWIWKRICRVQDKFAGGFSGTGQWLAAPAGYSVTSGYEWIKKTQPVVTWDKVIWNSWCLPKHNFINWLIAREALLLKDRLLQIGIAPDSDCCICGACAGTHNHLFFHCPYTRKLIWLLSCKLNVRMPAENLLIWIQSKPWAQVKKRVLIAWFQALYYAIWHQRNKARLEGMIDHPASVIKQISSIMHTRSIFLA